MRDYGVVRVRFWEWAKRKRLNAEERELALYLLTSPHGNSLGCFRLPMAYLCDDLGRDIETVTKTVSRLSEIGFLERDEATGWTWIVGFLEHNPIPNRNVGKAIEKQIDAVPVEVPFYGRMVEALQSVASPDDKGISAAFLDRVSERYRNRSVTVSKPLNESVSGLKTHTQTQTHEHTHEHEHKPGASGGVPSEDPDILKAFNAWSDAAERHPRWPKAQDLNLRRRTALKGRIQDADGLPGYLAVLAKAEASKFICNEMKGWSLDWFLKAANFTKVREGNYDDDRRTANGVTHPPADRADGWEAMP
jgi:hypothetical protein